MKKIIIATHGELSKGILNSAEMIIGKQENIKFFSLVPGGDPESIANDIQKEIDKNKDDLYIILTDLIGGSVHTACSKLIENKNVKVISGINLCLMLEVILLEDNEKIDENIKIAIQRAKQTMIFLNDYLKEQEGSDDEWLNC